MGYQEMLEWLIAHPEVQVRRAHPTGYIAVDMYNGLEILTRGEDYREVIPTAAAKVKEKGR